MGYTFDGGRHSWLREFALGLIIAAGAFWGVMGAPLP